MKFAGIIAEYDPFHNGHAAQLAAVRAAGADCVGCLSEQRRCAAGRCTHPAGIGPGARRAGRRGRHRHCAARALRLRHGRSNSPRRGWHLLAALGCDTLAFGAETPDAAALLDAAQLLLSGEINALIRKKLATGMTYAAARADAAETLRPGMGALLRTPNNILGIEYCKAILAQGAALTPLALPRLGAAHGGGAGEHGGTPMASASYLRGLPLPEWTAFVPAGAAALYAKAAAEGLLLDSGKI